MASDPRTVGDELVRAADRDIEQLRYIEKLYERVVDLLEHVGTLEADLAAERTARERLELRVYAGELRERGLPLLTDADGTINADGSWSPTSRNVLPLIRRYAPDTEPLPTTDNHPTDEGSAA